MHTAVPKLPVSIQVDGREVSIGCSTRLPTRKLTDLLCAISAIRTDDERIKQARPSSIRCRAKIEA